MRRTAGSVEDKGKLPKLCTGRATRVPSTKSCKMFLCSLSRVTTTTASSGMTALHPFDRRTSTYQPRPHLTPPGAPPSNLPLARKRLQYLGVPGASLLGDIRCTVHSNEAPGPPKYPKPFLDKGKF